MPFAPPAPVTTARSVALSLRTFRRRFLADTINSVNGKREIVDCGAGRDSVRADKADRVKGCEKLKRSE